MSRSIVISRSLILIISVVTLSLASFNCYQEVCAPESESDVHAQQLSTVETGSIIETASVEYNHFRVRIKANVVNVKDQKSYLDGLVKIGDEISGFIVYDATSVDNNPDPEVSEYMFDSMPSSVELFLSGLRFQSHMNSPNIRLQLANDKPSEPAEKPADICKIFSINNMDVFPGVSVNSIEVFLKDKTGCALSGDELSDLNPFPNNWPTIHKLFINGDRWQIKADITSFSDANGNVNDTGRDPGVGISD